MAKRQSRREPEPRRGSTSLRIHKVQALTSFANNVVRWSGAVALSFFGYKTVAVLAGEYTSATIGIQLLTDIRVSEAVAWIFGTGGMAYGWRQRKLRKDATERWAPRVADLEQQLDARRSSSRLTTRGNTNPGDAL